jgi:hypothetical protein
MPPHCSGGAQVAHLQSGVLQKSRRCLSRSNGSNLGRCVKAHRWADRHHHPDLNSNARVQVHPRSIALYKQGTETTLYRGWKCHACLKDNDDGMQVCDTLA